MCFGWRTPRQASIIHQDIDFAVISERLLSDLFHRGRIRHIANHGIHLHTLIFQCVFGLIEPLFAASSDHYMCTRCTKRLRDLKSKSARPSSDKGNLASEVKGCSTHKNLLIYYIDRNSPLFSIMAHSLGVGKGNRVAPDKILCYDE